MFAFVPEETQTPVVHCATDAVGEHAAPMGSPHLLVSGSQVPLAHSATARVEVEVPHTPAFGSCVPFASLVEHVPVKLPGVEFAQYWLVQSLSCAHAAVQACVVVLQTAPPCVAPEPAQSLFEEQVPHVPADAPVPMQNGAVDVGQADAAELPLSAVQAAHEFDTQTGVVPLQSVFAEQPSHLPAFAPNMMHMPGVSHCEVALQPEPPSGMPHVLSAGLQVPLVQTRVPSCAVPAHVPSVPGIIVPLAICIVHMPAALQ